MSLILSRKSIRKFTTEGVDQTSIDAMLTAAMQAPSARNQQPWEFIVIKNKPMIDQLSEVSNGAKPLKSAPLAIMPVIKKDAPAPHMCPQDLAAATQNILLTATELNLGAVWIGVFPLEDRIQKVREIIDLPSHLTPFCMIAIGHPDQSTEVTKLRYDASRITVVE